MKNLECLDVLAKPLTVETFAYLKNPALNKAAVGFEEFLYIVTVYGGSPV